MRRILALIGGLGLAMALSQFPEYAQQYTQRLGGAVDELAVIVADFDDAARDSGLDRQTALARYIAADDDFLALRGESMTRTFLRFDQLSATLVEIEGANPIERFQNLPLYLDSDIGSRTLEAYRPAIPITPEGFIYAGGGLLAGYLIVSGLFRFCMLPFAGRRRSPRYET